MNSNTKSVDKNYFPANNYSKTKKYNLIFMLIIMTNVKIKPYVKSVNYSSILCLVK